MSAIIKENPLWFYYSETAAYIDRKVYMAFTDIIHDDIMLRQIEHCHAMSIFDQVEASRDCLQRWLPWVDTTTSVADIDAFITTSNHRYDEDGSVTAIISWRSHISGIVSLINRTEGTYEVGYWLSVNYQGHGIMTTAVQLMVDYAFAVLHAKCVEIRVQPTNTKSRAIPERLGFTIIRIDHIQAIEMVVYSMTLCHWSSETDRMNAI